MMQASSITPTEYAAWHRADSTDIHHIYDAKLKLLKQYPMVPGIAMGYRWAVDYIYIPYDEPSIEVRVYLVWKMKCSYDDISIS